MRNGLTQSNLDKGHELFMDVSDPASARYARHYIAEEVIDIFAPAPETVEAVYKWLHSAGIESARITHSADKQWLGFDATTAEAEELLLTEYHFYEHSRTGQNTIASDEYYVPAHIQHHVDSSLPVLNSSPPVAHRTSERLRSGPFDAQRATIEVLGGLLCLCPL